MAVEALRQAAVAELSRLLEEAGSGFPAAVWVWKALRARGKALAQERGFCWGVLSLLVCQAVGGDPRVALPLSAAAECFVAAADTLDDVQDRDAGAGLWRKCGVGTAVNVGAFLLFLTQLALGRLAERGVPSERVCEVARAFAAAGLRARCGQQRDLDQESTGELDEAAYLAAMAGKSASLVECICRSAAVVAGADPGDVEACARFGFDVGMALQIGNDVAGASTESADRGDLRLGKRTLPVLFALERAPEPVREELAGILRRSRPDGLSLGEVERVRGLLESSGALLYAAFVADVYWERAVGGLAGLGSDRALPLLELVAQMREGCPEVV